MQVIQGELEDYVQYPGTDCRNGALLKVTRRARDHEVLLFPPLLPDDGHAGHRHRERHAGDGHGGGGPVSDHIAEGGLPVLQMRGISKSFFGVEVLHQVDFTVDKGEIMGLCGENGAGKSTLMKILAGIHCADAGEVDLQGSGHPAQRDAAGDAARRRVHDPPGAEPAERAVRGAEHLSLPRAARRLPGSINFNRMNEEAARDPGEARREDRSAAQGAGPEDRPEADGGDRQGHLLQRGAARHGRAHLPAHRQGDEDPLRPDRQPRARRALRWSSSPTG